MAPSRFDRRALGLMAGSALAGLIPTVARASRGWCRVDPIFRVDAESIQKDYHLWVAINARGMSEARRLVTAPVEVVVVLPRGLNPRRLDDASGFGEGFTVEFEEARGLAVVDGEVQMRVRVRVPASQRRRVKFDLEELVDLRPLSLGKARGVANEWIELDIP